MPSLEEMDRIHVPIQVRSLDITQAFWFARGDQHQIGWNEIITLQADDIPYSNILPRPVVEGVSSDEDFGFARVKLGVRLVSFLRSKIRSCAAIHHG
jgi:hypothetical protein